MAIIERISIYRSRNKFYFIGKNNNKDSYKLLKILIEDGPEPEIIDDGVVYTKDKMDRLIQDIASACAKPDQLVEIIADCHGIIGFVKFTKGYYVSVIKKSKPVSLLGGHYIYHIEEAKLLPLFDKTDNSVEEERFLQVFQSVDLAKNFYFSFTYDLTNTLQKNMTNPPPTDIHNALDAKILPNLNTMFVWNYQLICNGKLKLEVDSSWMISLIHGYVDQSKLSVLGRDVFVTLIARRSRVFAGVRFMKRGVDAKGYVANDVETEQIVHTMEVTSFDYPSGIQNSNPNYTAFVQHRGSIPLFWSQDTSAMKPKPPIELNLSDPYYSVSKIHFQQLFKRYGTPVIVLNLIKTKESTKRESILGVEFSECINFLNLSLPEDKKILYIKWDMSRSKHNRQDDVLQILEEIAEETLAATGFFHNGPELYGNYLKRVARNSSQFNKTDGNLSLVDTVTKRKNLLHYRREKKIQHGVVRSNCIDCLDRTNAAQSIIGKVALAHQLHELGCLDQPFLTFDTDAAMILEEMYHDLGDTIALQYGGSHLVNTVQTYRKINNWTSHSRDLIVTLRRYYSNSFVDTERQKAITLFLEKSTLSEGLNNKQIKLDEDDPFHCNDIAKNYSVINCKSKFENSQDSERFSQYHIFDSQAFMNDPNTIGSEETSERSEHSDSPSIQKFDYWAEYYNIKEYTSFDSLYLSHINCNSKYNTMTTPINEDPFVSKSGEKAESNRFYARISPKWLNTSKPEYKKVDLNEERELMLSKANGQKRSKAKRNYSKHTSYSGALDVPQVSQKDCDEYENYINQFKNQSFFKDIQCQLSSKHETSDLWIPKVDEKSEKIYEEYIDSVLSESSPMIV